MEKYGREKQEFNGDKEDDLDIWESIRCFEVEGLGEIIEHIFQEDNK